MLTSESLTKGSLTTLRRTSCLTRWLPMTTIGELCRRDAGHRCWIGLLSPSLIAYQVYTMLCSFLETTQGTRHRTICKTRAAPGCDALNLKLDHMLEPSKRGMTHVTQFIKENYHSVTYYLWPIYLQIALHNTLRWQRLGARAMA